MFTSIPSSNQLADVPVGLMIGPGAVLSVAYVSKDSDVIEVIEAVSIGSSVMSVSSPVLQAVNGKRRPDVNASMAQVSFLPA